LSFPIPKALYDKLHALVRENPNITNAEIGRRIGLGKDAVAKWRSRPDYGKYVRSAPEPVAAKPPVEKLTPTEEHQLKRENAQLKKQLQQMFDEQVAPTR